MDGDQAHAAHEADGDSETRLELESSESSEKGDQE